MIEIIASEEILLQAQELFTAENGTFNPVWRIMRLATVADVLYQHCTRLKYHLDTKEQCAPTERSYENVRNEFLFIMNNAIIGYIQLTKGVPKTPETTALKAEEMYKEAVGIAITQFDKEPPASECVTVHFFHECIHQIVYELRLGNGERVYNREKDEHYFLNLVVYAMCGAQLVWQ